LKSNGLDDLALNVGACVILIIEDNAINVEIADMNRAVVRHASWNGIAVFHCSLRIKLETAVIKVSN
jgi:hypothetical protein